MGLTGYLDSLGCLGLLGYMGCADLTVEEDWIPQDWKKMGAKGVIMTASRGHSYIVGLGFSGSTGLRGYLDSKGSLDCLD